MSNQIREPFPAVFEPRYAAPREVSGIIFDDPDYPDHYAVPGRERRVSAAVLAALAELLKGAQ